MREIEKINSDVEDLLIKYGPDGHTDGSKQITEYIVNLVNNKLQDAIDWVGDVAERELMQKLKIT